MPIIRPSGASRHSVIGAVMTTISRGFKKFFDHCGVKRSTRISTYLSSRVDSIAGIMDDE